MAVAGTRVWVSPICNFFSPSPHARQVPGYTTASLPQLRNLQVVSWPQLSRVDLLSQECGMGWWRLSSASAVLEREVQESWGWHSSMGPWVSTGALLTTQTQAGMQRKAECKAVRPQRNWQDKLWADGPVLGPRPLGSSPLVSLNSCCTNPAKPSLLPNITACNFYFL